jgi:dephospho-CoA kinase
VNMTDAKLAGIMARQMSDFEKRQKAHFVIDTNGSLRKTGDQVRQLLRAAAGLEGRSRHA